MRKNAPRKWLHAILDLLPVILIPVFMIYSHRHTIDSGSIQVPQNEVVDFNQHFEYNDFVFNFSYDNDDTRTYNYSGYMWENHIYIISFEVTNVVNPNNNRFAINVGLDSSFYIGTLQNDGYVQFRGLCPTTGNVNYLYLVRDLNIDLDCTFTFSHYNIYDLTQMFGSGNEPSIEQFNIWFNEPYYDYVPSKNVLIKDVSTITYDDTDIMSQSMYQLYNSVDKYFNMNNIFNMGAVYDWFVLNVFSGNAPLIMYIVWNIALYELVMDLMFLLYALFMWFVDWCKSLIERTYDVGRGK